MITLFRRIRRKLLSENRITRYLLYALGEILLVVIGILIALQVNNWNQQRIQLNKEKVYLKEIRRSLLKDTTAQNRVVRFNRAKVEIINGLIVEMGKTKSKSAHLLYLFGTLNRVSPNEGNLVHYDVFEQNRAAFDNMVQAENIDLIREDSLRFMLTEYYRGDIVESGTQERVKQIVRDFTDLIIPWGITRESAQLIMNLETSYPSAEELEPINNPRVAGQLFLMLKNAESQTAFLKEIQDNTIRIIERIDRYLDSEQ